MSAAPSRVRLRTYRVGFGDCFLLSVEYGAKLDDGRSARHVLIDFGSNHAAPGGTDLEAIATRIAKDCGGRLDAIVVTHRHKDHVSGFAHQAAAKIIGGLKPRAILRPWTEDPEAKKKATGKHRDILSGLDEAQSFAQGLADAIGPKARGLRGDLRSLAMRQVANKVAIANLDTWAKGKGKYLSAGDRSGLERILPGVAVTVLGPPTIDDWPDVKKQRSTDPEYWMLLGRALGSGRLPTTPLEEESGRAERSAALGPQRWLIEQMRRQHVGILSRIVESMDRALNNTSLILLFKIGGRRLLFSGDAQIENWEYFFEKHPKRKTITDEIRKLDLYKVGHHGSRNATPRHRLFGLWTDKHRMTFVVSTLSDVYGTTEATKVPRATLLAALDRRGDLFSTERFAEKQSALELVAPANGSGRFTVVTGR